MNVLFIHEVTAHQPVLHSQKERKGTWYKIWRVWWMGKHHSTMLGKLLLNKQ